MQQEDFPAVSVLVVDDHDTFRFLLDRQFEAVQGYRFVVREAGAAEEALSILRGDPGIEVVLLDRRLGEGVDGLEVFKRLRAEGDDRPVVMMTAVGDPYLTDEMTRCGVEGYLEKDEITPDRLARTIGRVLEKR